MTCRLITVGLVGIRGRGPAAAIELGSAARSIIIGGKSETSTGKDDDKVLMLWGRPNF